MRSLDAVLGYRHSECDLAGGADAWKAELLYKPNDILRLRGRSGRSGHRACSSSTCRVCRSRTSSTRPPIRAFYSAQRTGPNAAVTNRCVSPGVPSFWMTLSRTTTSPVSAAESRAETGGRYTATISFVLSRGSSIRCWPNCNSRSTGTVWRWTSRSRTAPETIPACFDPAVNVGMSTTNYCGCANPGTGQIEHSVDMLLNTRIARGWHARNSTSNFRRVGRVAINALASWWTITKFRHHNLPQASAPALAGASAARDRVEAQSRGRTTGVSWASESHGATSTMQDADAPRTAGITACQTRTIRSRRECHFGAGVFDDVTLRAGVENLTDEQPPLLRAGSARIRPSQYDVGRRHERQHSPLMRSIASL